MNDDRRAVATLLLVVQAGLALLAALGLVVFARLSNAVGGLAGAEATAIGELSPAYVARLTRG